MQMRNTEKASIFFQPSQKNHITLTVEKLQKIFDVNNFICAKPESK